MKNDFEKLSNQALRIPLIDIYSEGERIDNRTLYVKLDKNDFDLSNIYVKNHGDGITKFISVKLYISNDITARPSEWWEKQTSFDENYKSLIYWGAQVPVSPGESWNLPVIKGKLKDQNITQLECKIEIFYGGNKPALSKFIVSFKK